MTDSEILADKIVALGVGNNMYDLYAIGAYHVIGCTASDFVRDWRVAGALMEKCDSTYPEKLIDGRWQVQASVDAMPTEWITTESLPRAIIEACCEALDG